MQNDVNTRVFLALVKAGLWEQDVRFPQIDKIEYSEVLRLAEEQTVVGLVTAGLEHVTDVKVPKEDLLQFVGRCLQLEQRNDAMNYFIGVIIEQMHKAGIYTILVKGQGIAQCYERPRWRASGDVDFLLSDDNYRKARSFLEPLATVVNDENPFNKHLAFTINPWTVELHGTLRGLLKKRIDNVVDQAQRNIFYGGSVRSWMNGKTQVFLPQADEDVVFIFSHLLQHFFKEGIALRQICDWCRLLWSFRDTIDKRLLERRLREMGVMSEWKTFASLTVDYLGMPKEAMPFYDSSSRWSSKARKLLYYILKPDTDCVSREDNPSYFKRKAASFWRHTKQGARHFALFPMDSIIIWFRMIRIGLSIAWQGK